MKTFLWVFFLVVHCVLANKPAYYDKEKSNYVGKEEMHKVVDEGIHELDPKAKVEKEDDMYYFFSLHDYNNDGHLDPHELRYAFTEHDTDHTITLKDVEEMVNYVIFDDDRDNDGVISWDEYLESQAYHSP